MIFERENCKAIQSPSPAQIARELSLTKSSFASLTAQDGSYVQVGGGPGLFLLEWRGADGKHCRGSQLEPAVPFPDGTTLSFGGSTVALARNEWFLAAQVVEVFNAFLSGATFPTWLSWLDLTSEYTRAS